MQLIVVLNRKTKNMIKIKCYEPGGWPTKLYCNLEDFAFEQQRGWSYTITIQETICKIVDQYGGIFDFAHDYIIFEKDEQASFFVLKFS